LFHLILKGFYSVKFLDSLLTMGTINAWNSLRIKPHAT
jgi:hypothetical protein